MRHSSPFRSTSLLVGVLAATVLGVLPSARAQSASDPIISLRSASGHWLSANPQGGLYASTNPNASAWEQWQFVKTPNGGYALQSFHGTRLIYIPMANRNPSPVHTVATPWDQGTFFNFFGTNGKFASSLVSGGALQIQMRPNETMTYVELVETTSGVVEWKQFNNYATPTAADLWTVTVESAPVMPRGPTLTALMDTGGYNLKASDQSYFTWSGTTPSAAQHGGAPIARPPGFTTARDQQTSTAPLTYGAEVYLRYSGGNVTLQPDAIPAGLTLPGVKFDYSPNVTNDKWVLLDPRAPGNVGGRIILGGPVCLKNVATNRTLSANPGIPALLLSPNGCGPTGAWETWTTVAAQ